MALAGMNCRLTHSYGSGFGLRHGPTGAGVCATALPPHIPARMRRRVLRDAHPFDRLFADTLDALIIGQRQAFHHTALAIDRVVEGSWRFRQCRPIDLEPAAGVNASAGTGSSRIGASLPPSATRLPHQNRRAGTSAGLKCEFERGACVCGVKGPALPGGQPL